MEFKCNCEFVPLGHPYEVPNSGFEQVTLIGVQTCRFPDCDKGGVVIRRFGHLMQLMYYSVLIRPGRLQPDDIVRLRNCRGFNQGELARLLGVSQPVLCRWETGKRRPSRISDLAVRLGFLTFPAEHKRLGWEDGVQRRLAGYLGELVRMPEPDSWPIVLDVRKQPEQLIEGLLERAEQTLAGETPDVERQLQSAVAVEA